MAVCYHFVPKVKILSYLLHLAMKAFAQPQKKSLKKTNQLLPMFGDAESYYCIILV